MGNLPTLWLTAMDLPTEMQKSFKEEGLDEMGLEWSQVDLQHRIAWIHADQAKAGKPILKAGGTACRNALDRAGIRKYEEKDRRIKNSLYPHHAKNSLYPHHADDDYRFSDFRWHDLRHTWASGTFRLEHRSMCFRTRGLEQYQDGTEVRPPGLWTLG